MWQRTATRPAPLGVRGAHWFGWLMAELPCARQAVTRAYRAGVHINAFILAVFEPVRVSNADPRFADWTHRHWAHEAAPSVPQLVRRDGFFLEQRKTHWEAVATPAPCRRGGSGSPVVGYCEIQNWLYKTVDVEEER